MMRVVTGGISHETSTFTPIPTTLGSYDERFNLRGAAMLETFRATNTPIGGFIEGAEVHGFELIPTLFVEAFPSAPTPRRVFDLLLGELLQRIEEAGPIDGVLLDLHGAMICEGIDDAESHSLMTQPWPAPWGWSRAGCAISGSSRAVISAPASARGPEASTWSMSRVSTTSRSEPSLFTGSAASFIPSMAGGRSLATMFRTGSGNDRVLT
jgi:hypothetical protein